MFSVLHAPLSAARRLIAGTVARHKEEGAVLADCALINMQRIYSMASVATLIHGMTIISFLTQGSGDTAIRNAWRHGIIVSHAVLLLFMVGIAIAAKRLRKQKEPTYVFFAIQYGVLAVLMLAGIGITAIDQLVTDSITPFLLCCAICGTVLVIRPLYSILVNSLAFIIFYHAIAIHTNSPDILLSTRVNGLTAIGLGLVLNLVMWRYNYINITQRRRIEIQQRQLEQMAHHDPLTGLTNRRWFDQVVEQELVAIRLSEHQSSIIMIDVDDFKEINDTYGHPFGDSVLQQLAGVLSRHIGQSGTISRLGGEEFIILLPHTSLRAATAVAEELRLLVMAASLGEGPTQTNITASFGVCRLTDERLTGSASYCLADQALYQAKRKGKNLVVTAGEDGTVMQTA